MATAKTIKCPMCNRSSIVILYDTPNGDFAEGACYCINEKRNAVLSMLREDGHDIRPSLFVKKGAVKK